jgi:MoaD family protein
MKIMVKGYFNLKKAMGDQAVVEVEKEVASIKDILNYLRDKFGKDLTELIFDRGTDKLADHIMLFVNGHNYLTMPNLLDTELKHKDEIALFPPIAGG